MPFYIMSPSGEQQGKGSKTAWGINTGQSQIASPILISMRFSRNIDFVLEIKP